MLANNACVNQCIETVTEPERPRGLLESVPSADLGAETLSSAVVADWVIAVWGGMDLRDRLVWGGLWPEEGPWLINTALASRYKPDRNDPGGGRRVSSGSREGLG